MNNLHISLTSFKNESRVLKQARTLAESDVFAKVYIAALYSEGLDKDAKLGGSILLKRFDFVSNKFGNTFLAQIFKYIEFVFALLFYYRTKSISVVTIHSSTLLVLGVLLKLFFRSSLIYDAHELESERNGLKGFRKVITKFVEKRLIRYCDKVIVVSESIADWYEINMSVTRPVVVLNAPVKICVPNEDLFRSTFNIPNDVSIFLYQGMLSKGRGIELIIKTFKCLDLSHKCVVVFMGYGPLEGAVREACDLCSNIFFHEAVSPDVVLHYTASADYGLSLIENKCLSYYFCMPNKIFEYTMVGLPVVCSDMLDMAKFVSGNDVGIVMKEPTVECLSESILKIKNIPIEAFKQRCMNVSFEFCWDVQGVKLVNCYQSVFADK